jgi:hypothetical protein
MKRIIALFFIVLTFNLKAASVDGINFPDKVKIDNKDLVLNGIGIRKATFLKIKVYYGALYLEAKNKDATSFMATKSPKQIIMHFVRDVDAKKLRDGFVEGMEAANKNHASLKSQLEKFNAQVTDVKKGDEFIVNFHEDGVSLVAKGKVGEKIQGADFSSALLNIWFTNPRDEDLKNGLLGL